MAITEVVAPSSPAIAYRPIVFQLDSDDANIVNLVIEVLVGSTRVAAFNVSPDLGTTDEFTFSISDVLQKNVSFILKTLGSSAIINDADNINYNIKAYEVTLSGGLLTTTYDPDDDNNAAFNYQSTTKACFNWLESHLDYAGFTISDYSMTAVTSKFLTDAPTSKDIELGQNEFLGMAWASSTGGVKNYLIEILTYNSSDALLNTDTLSVSDWNEFNVSELVDPYLDVPVGTANLIAAGVSLTNVAYYTIQLVNDDGDKSEVRRFNIVPSCTDTDTRIHFVNKFGKQDSITLKGNAVESLEHKQTLYQKALGNTYSSSARGLDVIQNISVSQFTAFSKSIGREVLAFANTMLVNKMAFVEIDSNYFPIIIEDGTKVVRDELGMPIQFVLNYSFANQNKGLRG